MAPIYYFHGNLFDVKPNPGTVLVHACNTQGVWGSGIALEFATRFPRAYRGYQDLCKYGRDVGRGSLVPVLPGDHAIFEDGGYLIGCLFTSKGFGRDVDAPESIVAATARSVQGLLAEPGVKSIFSPKINSGLFKVPWHYTAMVIEAVMDAHAPFRDSVTWAVYSP
ncbi:macro domain-containing protein [Myxococcus phage Mx1]|nr:macro domain-containing protein [Myxococcus phage Mx1]